MLENKYRKSVINMANLKIAAEKLLANLPSANASVGQGGGKRRKPKRVVAKGRATRAVKK
jgi:hypothetical protein